MYHLAFSLAFKISFWSGRSAFVQQRSDHWDCIWIRTGIVLDHAHLFNKTRQPTSKIVASLIQTLLSRIVAVVRHQLPTNLFCSCYNVIGPMAVFGMFNTVMDILQWCLANYQLVRIMSCMCFGIFREFEIRSETIVGGLRQRLQLFEMCCEQT
jgi:hypothetical protein